MANTVLLIDDDPQLLDVLAMAIEAPGRRIDKARNRHAAEAMLARQRYDLVIMDIFLPDTRGLELVDFIKDQDLDYPVILMSGYLEPDEALRDDDAVSEGQFRMEAERKGVTATLRKPLDLERLRALVKETLDA